MTYGGSTSRFGLPYLLEGGTMTEAEERRFATILDNLLKAAIMGAGGNRVFVEGDYTVSVSGLGNQTSVVLSGSPSLQAICNFSLVEVFQDIVWTDMLPDTLYYLYIKTSASTLEDPSDIAVVPSTSVVNQQDHLLLATIDTTDASLTFTPVVDSTPQGKPLGYNLFEVLNSGTDPFGQSLVQTFLTVLQGITVYLEQTRTFLIAQRNQDATLPVISIQNQSDQPELYSSNELRFADSRLLDGFALTEPGNSAFIGSAISIIGALNEILGDLNDFMTNNHDPFGPDLFQTNLTISGLLDVARIVLNPVEGQLDEIHSNGRLRFTDSVTSMDLTETLSPPGPPGSPPASPPPPGSEYSGPYTGVATSIVGALNELRALLLSLNDTVVDVAGQTIPPKSPITIIVAPDEIGQNLHFVIQVSDQDDFSSLTTSAPSELSPPVSPPVTGDVFQVNTREDPDGWYYSVFPQNFDQPVFSPFPSSGLPPESQTDIYGRQILVQYRPSLQDPLFLNRLYRVSAAQDNGLLDVPQLSPQNINTIVFG